MEYVSPINIYSYGIFSIYFFRHIFGSLPTNVDEEDLVQPVISSLNTLKAQRACKAAARHQATEATRNASPSPGQGGRRVSPSAASQSLTESETEEEDVGPHPAAPTSENPLPSSPRAQQQSWNFSDQNLPPGVRRKSVTSKPQAPGSRPLPPLHFSNARASTPPLHPSTSVKGHLRRVPSSEPPRGRPAKQRNAEKTQSGPQRSSPISHLGRLPNKNIPRA